MSLSLYPPAASSSAAPPSSMMPPASASSLSSALRRSASGSLDEKAARRCWAKLDLSGGGGGGASGGTVTAQDLLQYLSKFCAQQNQINDSNSNQGIAANGRNASNLRRSPLPHDDEEAKSSAPHHATSSFGASASASSFNGRSSPSSSSLASRARMLSSQASAVTLKDLEELLLFADANGDGKLDQEEMLAAYAAFSHPPVSLATGRFESRIISEGLEGARPPRRELDPTSLGFRAQLGLGSGAPVLAAAPGGSPQPPARASALGPLPNIFAHASLPAQPPQYTSASTLPAVPPPAAAASGSDVAAGNEATQPMDDDHVNLTDE